MDSDFNYFSFSYFTIDAPVRMVSPKGLVVFWGATGMNGLIR